VTSASTGDAALAAVERKPFEPNSAFLRSIAGRSRRGWMPASGNTRATPYPATNQNGTFFDRTSSRPRPLAGWWSGVLADNHKHDQPPATRPGVCCPSIAHPLAPTTKQ
jgi:hypothetical protein